MYQTEKVLREQGDNVSAEEKEAVEQPLAELKKALEGNDTAAIKTATETLMSASQAFSQKLYEAAARDANAAGTSALTDGILINAPQDTTAGVMNAGVADNIATITFDDDMPARCWMAPEMPAAM